MIGHAVTMTEKTLDEAEGGEVEEDGCIEVEEAEVSGGEEEEEVMVDFPQHQDMTEDLDLHEMNIQMKRNLEDIQRVLRERDHLC